MSSYLRLKFIEEGIIKIHSSNFSPTLPALINLSILVMIVALAEGGLEYLEQQKVVLHLRHNHDFLCNVTSTDNNNTKTLENMLLLSLILCLLDPEETTKAYYPLQQLPHPDTSRGFLTHTHHHPSDAIAFPKRRRRREQQYRRRQSRPIHIFCLRNQTRFLRKFMSPFMSPFMIQSGV